MLAADLWRTYKMMLQPTDLDIRDLTPKPGLHRTTQGAVPRWALLAEQCFQDRLFL